MSSTLKSLDDVSKETTRPDIAAIWESLRLALSSLSEEDRNQVLERLDDCRETNFWITAKPPTEANRRIQDGIDAVSKINRANAKYWEKECLRQ